MKYVRMPIEIESPEQMGYENVKFNLTESSFTDTRLGSLDLNLNDLVLCYGDHVGHRKLRELIAQDAGPGVTADDVLLTAGAATALFMISTSLLEKGDALLVERPNYATNIETPKAIGAEIDAIELKFENGFRPVLTEIEQKLRPNTKFISITVPHNPTGTMITREELDSLIALVEKRGLYLLVDETYRDMTFKTEFPVAASLSPRVMSVSSLSKTYGLPGIRLGWIVCRDKKLMETLLAAKEQIMICGSIVDEEIAYRYWLKREEQLPRIKKAIAEKFAITKEWFQSQPHLEWVEPQGGVVCFPRMKAGLSVTPEKFYEVLNSRFKTFVGPGHWFEMDRRYMRIGFGWPSQDELKQGLRNITEAFEVCLKG